MEDTITSGKALERFRALIKAQKGDTRVIEDYTVMPQAKYRIPLIAQKSGVISEIEADEVGIASMMLGGGRQKTDDQLDYAVGIELHKKIGDTIHEGEPILTIYSDQKNVDEVKQLLTNNIKIFDHAEKLQMIYQIIK